MESALLIRFSIEKLNELPGPYEYQEGFLIGNAVPSELMSGMTILTGDTLKTLRRQEYISLVAIVGAREILQKDIELRIVSDEEISKRKADPLTQLVTEINESLSLAGTVQMGTLEENGWCSKGLLCAWDQSARQKRERDDTDTF